MLEFVTEDCLLLIDAGQGGENEVKREIAGATDDVGSEDAFEAGMIEVGRLGFAVKGLLEADTGDEVEVAQVDCARKMRRQPGTVGELIGLKFGNQGVPSKMGCERNRRPALVSKEARAGPYSRAGGRGRQTRSPAAFGSSLRWVENSTY